MVVDDIESKGGVDAEYEFASEGKTTPKEGSEHAAAPKLDPHGFPLRPQPSDDPLGEYRF